MAELTLYSVTALLILDADGQRIMAKYYTPPHVATIPHQAGQSAPTQPTPVTGPPGLATLKEQRTFEKSVFEKIKRGGGEINPLPPYILLTRQSTDLSFHIVGPLSTSNELMLSSVLTSFHESVNTLLRGQVEKRSVLEGLDMVLLAADECVDDGIILETDSTAIAARVSRPRADTTDIVINEQTIMNAYSTIKDKMVQRIGQL